MGVIKLTSKLVRIACWRVLIITTFFTPAAQAERKDAIYAATVENFEGFAEGVAAAMNTPKMLSRVQAFRDWNDSPVKEVTFQDRNIELSVWIGVNGQSNYRSLTISRPGFALPVGLKLGAARAEVENWLGRPHTSEGNSAVYRRTTPVNEGCSDPMTLIFKDDKLVQITWQWESCND